MVRLYSILLDIEVVKKTTEAKEEIVIVKKSKVKPRDLQRSTPKHVEPIPFTNTQNIQIILAQTTSVLHDKYGARANHITTDAKDNIEKVYTSLTIMENNGIGITLLSRGPPIGGF